MKIYLDFDSTLVDFTKGWIDWLKKEKNIKIKAKDIEHWDWISKHHGEDVNRYWKTSGIYKNDIKPIAGSQEFIVILKYLYGEDNIFIISNSARNMEDEKWEYSKKHFNFNPSNFIHVADKFKYTSDGILIDDAPHNVVDHVVNNGKPAILFNYRNTYGWGKLEQKHRLITICNTYADCIGVIDTFKKFFPED